MVALFDGEGSSRGWSRWDRPRTYLGPTWESRLSDWIVAKARAIRQTPAWLLNIGVLIVLSFATFSVAAIGIRIALHA
jgi:hypothetical protein